MPANQTIVPVLFTAAADAPLAGRLADVVGRHEDPAQNIEGHLEQTTSMVPSGQNNINVWTHVADRMAVSLTQAVPYSIEIIQPKVPIVRDGSMELKIKATRKERYAADHGRDAVQPARHRLAQLVAIPEGKDEVILPLTANSGLAEVRVWKIAVLGTATVGNGSVMVSSQLADLEIAEPFVGFAYTAAAVEKGKETDVVITVTKNKDFDGNAKVEFLGCPTKSPPCRARSTRTRKNCCFM